MIINNSHVRGIFKYSKDVYFEKDDFVVDGNCIYICTSGDPIRGERPSLDINHLYYSEYPGDKIVSASEYYDYVKNTERGEVVEDKYVSAHSLCEILENMYFGFGDNGVVYDHVLYDPNTGIEYSVRGVREVLDYSTPNVLDLIVRKNDLNNGFLKVSRNLPEIRDLVLDNTGSDSDVVLLKQYTYLDSNDFIPYRVQELMDPGKNRLYFRFAKGEKLEDGSNDFTDAIVSKWKNLYTNDEDAIEKLNAIEDYYSQKIEEEESKIARLNGKYCYRNVEPTEYNHLGEGTVILRPGETRDIKTIERFDSNPCLLNILIKVQAGSGVYRNYSTVIDVKDSCDSPNNSSETYYIGDGISMTVTFRGSNGLESTSQEVTISVDTGVIKDIYYRDYTLGHVHDWYLASENILVEPTCTTEGRGIYECTECHEQKNDSIPPLGHLLSHKYPQTPTCVNYGWWEYWYCSRCQIYFKNSSASASYSGWDTGEDQVYRAALGPSGHNWGGWRVTKEATCTEDGVESRTCTICGETETRTIEATGHNLEHVNRIPETCGDFGVIEHYHCTNCGEDFEDSEATSPIPEEKLRIYPSGNHNLLATESKANIIKTPTYSDYPAVASPYPEYGIGLSICSSCGNEIEVQLPFRQHNLPSESREQPAFYSNGNHYPSYIEGFCSDCNETRRNYNWAPGIPISRQLSNHKVIGASSSESDNSETRGAQQQAVYYPATCDEYGYWVGTCSLCGESNVKQYNWNDPPLGHNITGPNRHGWIPNTCTEDALWRGKCSRCNSLNVTAVDEEHLKIGHVDDNHDDICDVCGKDLHPER